MPVIRRDGNAERRGLVNKEYPRNVVKRVADLEVQNTLPRGGVRGGGDPNFGYRIEVPLIADVTPHAIFDGSRFILSLELDLAYPTPVPTGFRYIEAEIDGDAGFHATARLSPYTSPWEIGDIGLEPDQTYQVRVRAVLSRGASEWGDWFTGITFGPAFFLPDPPTNLRIDTSFGIDGFYYDNPTEGRAGLKFDLALTEPAGYRLKYWDVAAGPDSGTIIELAAEPEFPIIVPGLVGHDYDAEVWSYKGVFDSDHVGMDTYTFEGPPLGPPSSFEFDGASLVVDPLSGHLYAEADFSWNLTGLDLTYIAGWEIIVTCPNNVIKTKRVNKLLDEATVKIEVGACTATIRAITYWRTVFGPEFTPPISFTVTVSLDPPTALGLDTSQGYDGFDWPGPDSIILYLSFTPPGTLPAGFIFRYWNVANPRGITEILLPNSATTVQIGPVINHLPNGSNAQYDGEILSYYGDLRGATVTGMSSITTPDKPLGPATDFAIEAEEPNTPLQQVNVLFTWEEPALMDFIAGWELRAIIGGGSEVNFAQRVGLVTAITLAFTAGLEIEAWV